MGSRLALVGLVLLVAVPGRADSVRDLDTPMSLVPGFEKTVLVGDWFEVAQTPTLLERDCHHTTVKVATRDDSRLTLKIACPIGAADGKVLPIEGVMAETDPGVFELRLVHLMELGNVTLAVVWQAPDASMVAIGAPRGEVGWIWSRVPAPGAELMEQARAAMVAAGYRASAIRLVDQAP